eukprot:1156469-Pelagomonas_calceolata.AAC.10
MKQLFICMAWVASLKAHTLRKLPRVQLGLRAGTPLVQKGVIHIFLNNSWVPWVGLQGLQGKQASVETLDC